MRLNQKYVWALSAAVFACCLSATPFVQAQLSAQTAQLDPDAGSSGSGNARVLSAAAQRQYHVGADDLLTISVWHQPDLSRTVPVRPDGLISLPLVGEIQAAGKTTPELEDEIRAALTHYLKDPELTVMVAQIRSRRVNVIGEVGHPGTLELTQSMGVLDAIAAAGGLRDFAKKNKIYVLRETADGQRTRLHYDYEAVLKGKRTAQEIMLQANDTVVVP